MHKANRNPMIPHYLNNNITCYYVITEADVQLCHDEQWYVIGRFSRNCDNRRFPRSMRSQGERAGCGSHVKRVDTQMLSTHDVALRNVDGSLFHVQI